MNSYRQESPEVLYTDEEIVSVSQSNIDYLVMQSTLNERSRIRLCAHSNVHDRLHEMIIVHTYGTYVRPHKHIGKPESFHVIKGEVDVLAFDDDGGIRKVIRLGEYATGLAFYYRVSVPLYHTMLVRSEVLVFHEITTGPFVRTDTVFAPWSPAEDDLSESARFMARLEQMIVS
ncbi:MAG: WbuC family cupin fold metalloprotein [Desulfomonilaceae bacterium]